MTRDLTNEPANILTTTEFADRLAEMESIRLEVEVLDEAVGRHVEVLIFHVLCIG